MIKRLISILVLVFVWVASQAQYDAADTFHVSDLKVSASNVTRALIHLPGDYLDSTTKKYPVLIVLPGAGENGTTFAGLYNNLNSGGPSYFIAHGTWDTSFYDYVTAKYYKFIVVSPINTYVTPNPPNQTPATSSVDPYQLNYIIQDVYSRWRGDPQRLYLTGLSAGGQNVVAFAANIDPATQHPLNLTPFIKPAGIVLLSAEIGSLQKPLADSLFSKKTGVWGTGDPVNDVHGANTSNLIFYLNQDSSGYALFARNNFGHSHWDYYYNPNNWDTTWRGHFPTNIYNFLLSNKTNQTLSGNPIITVHANTPIYVLKNTTTTISALVAGQGGATISSILWTNVSGPVTPTIVSPTNDTTGITGLTSVGSYIFNIHAVDNNGNASDARDTVKVNAGCGGVRILPTPSVSDSGYYLSPANAAGVHPGDTILIRSQYFWNYISADSLLGTNSCPITIINDTGLVHMKSGFSFGGSQNVHVTGTGNATYFYGFYIFLASSPGGVGVQFSGKAKNCEADHIDMYRKTYMAWFKNEASCDTTLNNWLIDTISFHDSRAININQDGVYGGSTSPSGARTIHCVIGSNPDSVISPIPSRLANIKFYNLILDSVGRTGIQLSGAATGDNQIYGCHVTRTGYEFNPSQGSGIIAGGFTSAWIHNNYVHSTYQHNISCLGAGLNRIENNDLDSAGHIPVNGSDSVNIGFSSVSSDTRTTTSQWPNIGQPAVPRTGPPTALTLWVKNNKCGLTTNTKPPPTTLYNIDIGAGYNPVQPWGTGNIVCNNILQNGSPAIFSVNTNITYTTICGSFCSCSYYFSASGSDANTGTQASPFQTISKLNSLSSDTSASFFLNRGNSFFGGIRNFAGKRLDAYGTGVRPIVTGLINLTGWSVVSGNVYQTACSGCNVNTNLVLVNGGQQQMGRTPNTGYYTYQSHSGTTTITSSSLTGTPNYTGGQVVIRSCNACLATNNITGQSGGTLTYTSAAGQTPTDNFGLFIINDSLTLDTAYEWYYSPGLAQMKMYFPSGPSGITVQATGVDTLLSIASGEKNDTIANIDFEGAGICGICMVSDTGILVRNVKVRYSGGLGYYAVRGVDLRIDSSHISYCNDQGVLIDSASVNGYIGYDTVRTAGYIVGQARTLQGDDYRGVTNKSHLGVIEYNRVDSIGYDAIMGYQYSSIYKNYANKFCFVADDGGGIYSLGYKIGADTARLQYIRGNVLLNGIGASAGTNNLTFKPAYGVYTDNNNVNVIVDSNTIDSMAHSGIFNHNSRLIVTRNNTVYASVVSALQVQGDDATKPVRQNTTKKNYFGINSTGQQTIRFVSFNNIQFTATYGTLDSNYYFYSNLNPTPFLSYPSTNMAIKQWQDSTGETHPTIFVAPTLFQANGTQSSVSLPLLGKNYYDAQSTSYYNNATLPPLGSLMLIPGSFWVRYWGSKINFH